MLPILDLFRSLLQEDLLSPWSSLTFSKLAPFYAHLNSEIFPRSNKQLGHCQHPNTQVTSNSPSLASPFPSHQEAHAVTSSFISSFLVPPPWPSTLSLVSVPPANVFSCQTPGYIPIFTFLGFWAGHTWWTLPPPRNALTCIPESPLLSQPLLPFSSYLPGPCCSASISSPPLCGGSQHSLWTSLLKPHSPPPQPQHGGSRPPLQASSLLILLSPRCCLLGGLQAPQILPMTVPHLPAHPPQTSATWAPEPWLLRNFQLQSIQKRRPAGSSCGTS